jgi:hypothetical protein
LLPATSITAKKTKMTRATDSSNIANSLENRGNY